MAQKALVVDDNSKNLLLEKDLLQVAGFEVFAATNATDGIAVAMAEILDVIIMDVRLHDMRGSEAARLLRRQEKTRSTPIIFVTASVMSEGREEIADIPNSKFIGKPIDTRTFVREIREFMLHDSFEE